MRIECTALISKFQKYMINNQSRVEEILSWYPAFTGTQSENLLKLINFGRIGGSGNFVILPVDQGFEHGPGRSFEPSPSMYDPCNQAQLAIDAGCNAYAAPLGSLEIANSLIKESGIPTILKVNNHDGMMPDGNDPSPATTSWVEDAVRLGCAAVGFTIYPGSEKAREMYEQVRMLVADARKAGLIVVVWTYPRGSGLTPADESLSPKDIETAVDVVAYAVQIAALLGAHIIKCKPPKGVIGLKDSVKRGVYKDTSIINLEDRIRIIMKAAFSGKRIVINSGGESKGSEEIINEVIELKNGGSFGSIVGRNAFQRPQSEAVELLNKIQDIYVAV
jgi:fructose-bisphosphate aldolase, class I